MVPERLIRALVYTGILAGILLWARFAVVATDWLDKVGGG
ncbi:hypothetical protein Kpho01_67300 [Kitasatospora phosalacinea]|uniref:Uncharacterized protein n=1 Tax=Kitasatospora phosalacinea TaxID=2065 RepID=A0A9W6PLS3_9ACTN|nr:hypothetical protein Kpho01_67300 [Kitasatospora phosalacinea]